MNRPLSMTSFGRGEHEANGEKWVVELRSVNHRFSDIKVKLPREYAALEEKVKKQIATCINRGHVDVFVTLSGHDTSRASLEVNLSLAQEYFHCLQTIQKSLGLPDPPTLSLLAANRDLITPIEATADLEVSWDNLSAALERALQQSLVMKEAEGAALVDDLSRRLDALEETVQQIDTLVPDLLKQKETNLRERLDKLLDKTDLDPMRLAQEVAILADKSDITEEIVRLKSHIDQFRHCFTLHEPIGRQLDFLLQEFLREINTMASKISDSKAIHKTVFLKNEVEKMKEQVQNIE